MRETRISLTVQRVVKSRRCGAERDLVRRWKMKKRETADRRRRKQVSESVAMSSGESSSGGRNMFSRRRSGLF